MEEEVIYAEGMQEFIDRCNAILPPKFYHLPVETQREMDAKLTEEFYYEIPYGVTITDETLKYNNNKYKVRVYKTKKKSGNGVIFYLRGDAFLLGSLESHHTAAAEICDKTGLMTIAFDFRRSPESIFPAALEDCYGAICAVAQYADEMDIDPNKFVVSGDSSGANMALVLCMMSRDRSGPQIRGQGLISPILDFNRWCEGGEDVPLLDSEEIEYFAKSYAPNNEQILHPYVSPIVNGDFNNLPPAYIIGGEMDSLLYDAEECARKLQAANVEVELNIVPGIVHAAVRARGTCKNIADAWDMFCNKMYQLAQ